MREFEPFDVPDGTEKLIFPVERCETQLTLLFEIYCLALLVNACKDTAYTLIYVYDYD